MFAMAMLFLSRSLGHIKALRRAHPPHLRFPLPSHRAAAALFSFPHHDLRDSAYPLLAPPQPCPLRRVSFTSLCRPTRLLSPRSLPAQRYPWSLVCSHF